MQGRAETKVTLAWAVGQRKTDEKGKGGGKGGCGPLARPPSFLLFSCFTTPPPLPFSLVPPSAPASAGRSGQLLWKGGASAGSGVKSPAEPSALHPPPDPSLLCWRSRCPRCLCRHSCTCNDSFFFHNDSQWLTLTPPLYESVFLLQSEWKKPIYAVEARANVTGGPDR